MRRVEVIPYNPEWVLMFEEEAAKLREIFGELIDSIHHIGSTSVPGLAAKPVIDIMPTVQEISLVDTYNKEMEAIGYVAKGENGIPRRRYFKKGGDIRTHHVHIFETGSPAIERHIAFRDYLRAYHDDAKKYGDLKTKLAEQFPYDIESYIKGKESLVLEIERRALDWYMQHKK